VGRREIPSRRVGVHLVVALFVALLIGATAAGVWEAPTRAATAPTGVPIPAASPLTIQTWGFSPSTLSVDTSTSGSLSLAGGTAPYYAWVNGSAPGCGPSTNPVTLSGTTTQFTCNPTSTGNYEVHVDVVDSSVPTMKASQSTSLTVTSNNGGNGNGSNSNGNNSGGGSFSLPSNLIEYALIFGLIFVGAMVALAAGMIATAVIVGRRLRKLDETLSKMLPPFQEPKSPK
jgi:hypothetical protein